VKVKQIAKRAVSGGVPASSGDDLLRLIIDATMSTTAQSPTASTKLSKLKSKYFSLLNYVYSQKVKTANVDQFIKDHGGLNFEPSSLPKPKRRKRGSGT
jgi:hypothetical protein